MLSSNTSDTASIDISTLLADNLGNHTLDSNLKTNGYYISNDGDDEGLYVDNNGNVGIDTNNPIQKLHVGGNAIINGNDFSNFGDSAVLYIGDIQNKIRNTYSNCISWGAHPNG